MDWQAARSHFKQTWLTTLLSLILFAGVTYFLLWTECQTIQINLMLEELVSAAETIDVHTGDEAARYEGKVVHIVGPLRILEPISEPDYNIQVQAVKLRKRVQMYQWIEESTDQDNFISEPADESRKTYWYHKDWRDYVVDSSLFYIRPGHINPAIMPMSSETHIADNVKIGWAYLGIDVKRKVTDYYEIWSDSRPERSDIKLHSGFYYHGESALEHQIGDLRIHFSYAGREDDIYTAVGQVEGGTLQAYSPTRFPTADPICLLRKGSYTLNHLFELEKRDANIHTWQYRLFGFVQVLASAMTLHPDWVTIFLQSTWVSSNFRRCSRFWINFVLSCSYTLFIIALPWLIHKPAFGAIVLGCSMLPLLHYSTLMTRRDATQDAAQYTRWINTAN
ncbi:transmembrane protein 43 homolog isoform X1 [Spodoptera litura]|uniref:Transmembrane protein 43 homolog isoform X1 n=2 Tax=Spodoptera litura TaxID=69820 RepID=A0A9J7ITI4_SPOLT|nr:transmembrane protein 43 homolog isoform X1 [Spodoptera litura]XP_022827623.1 transmembrane protein 43 homolog isoform X1 [Spodoptera litura]